MLSISNHPQHNMIGLSDGVNASVKMGKYSIDRGINTDSQ